MKKYLLIVALLLLASISSAQYYTVFDTLPTNKILVDRDTSKASVIEDTLNGVRLKNGATCWDDVRVAGTSVRLGVTAPTFDVGTRTGGVYLIWYSGTQDDEGHTAIQMPHSWKPNTVIYPHVHLYPEVAPSGAQDTVVFGIEYFWLSMGDTALTPNSTDTLVNFCVITLSNYRSHLYCEFDSIPYNSFSSTNKTESSMLMVKIFRPATTDARDTYQNNCALLEFDVHFQVEKFGTKNETE